MAVIHGKAGKVTFSGAIASVLAWTLSITGELADSTVMHASVYWKTFIAGFIDSAATVEAQAMTESTFKVGTNAELQLYVDGTNYFSISTAICIGQTETVSKDDVGKISYSFIGDDTLGPVYG